MLPVARTTPAIPFAIQMVNDPENSTSEYFKTSLRTSSLAPRLEKMIFPKSKKIIAEIMPKQIVRIKPLNAISSAASISLEPIFWATNPVIAPPIVPAESIKSRKSIGKPRAKPASGTTPSWPIYQPSIIKVMTHIDIVSIFGMASLKTIDPIGLLRKSDLFFNICSLIWKNCNSF